MSCNADNRIIPFEKMQQYVYFSENQIMENYPVYDMADDNYDAEDDYDLSSYHEEKSSNPYARYIAQRLALEAYINGFNNFLAQTYGFSLGPEDYLTIPEGMFAIEDIGPHVRECQYKAEQKFRAKKFSEREPYSQYTQDCDYTNNSYTIVPHSFPENMTSSLVASFDENEDLDYLSEAENNNDEKERPLNETLFSDSDETDYPVYCNYLSDDHICSLDFVESEGGSLIPSDQNCCDFLQNDHEVPVEPTASSDSNGNVVAEEIIELHGTIPHLCDDSPCLLFNPIYESFRMSNAIVATILQRMIFPPEHKNIQETSNNFVLSWLCCDKLRYATSVCFPENYNLSCYSRGTVSKGYRGTKVMSKKSPYGIILLPQQLSTANSKKRHSPKVLLGRNIKLLADWFTLCHRRIQLHRITLKEMDRIYNHQKNPVRQFDTPMSPFVNSRKSIFPLSSPLVVDVRA
ncbi:hypothetical protein GLOIN_2v1782612 [Rhizophagus irregularis DAOM 181602=DAOM 197198]|uniref:Uncharacterized protein n=2 Tax=Rhizophagus irregularis TaxID=588596 RepID=A0A2P4PH09_RHIID|nr:hypothetical protein GLOIN_2v1782612 [Rhizophagus irregularis DAOM 181602=DAOM 197198]POG64671.1 hypothetical protein GLOIN_2v1782612 [Rhizophagus irregularis DAOM 181602=DAOM 197198]GBC32014.2 hypothetical protein GLOIN_2v1782612 [Rhizophagus irregularis DAOM 181602=DAOM 197198]|eukprot:XP_025171537.1 hypothetical protein GLOIN_2v1782612 [Rhizophagus irregularis DAOM 181602=DAOM 197198]